MIKQYSNGVQTVIILSGYFQHFVVRSTTPNSRSSSTFLTSLATWKFQSIFASEYGHLPKSFCYYVVCCCSRLKRMNKELEVKCKGRNLTLEKAYSRINKKDDVISVLSNTTEKNAESRSGLTSQVRIITPSFLLFSET